MEQRGDVQLIALCVVPWSMDGPLPPVNGSVDSCLEVIGPYFCLRCHPLCVSLPAYLISRRRRNVVCCTAGMTSPPYQGMRLEPYHSWPLYVRHPCRRRMSSDTPQKPLETLDTKECSGGTLMTANPTLPARGRLLCPSYLYHEQNSDTNNLRGCLHT